MAKPRSAAGGRRAPSDEMFARLRLVLSLLGDETRLRMVLALARDGELAVAALGELVGKPHSAVSHDLALLRLAGLVSYRVEGRRHVYRLEWGMLRDVLRRFFAEAGGRGREIRLGGCSLAFRGGK
jgi:DNA-binding transcriptional ArsR family regulator